MKYKIVIKQDDLKRACRLALKDEQAEDVAAVREALDLLDIKGLAKFSQDGRVIVDVWVAARLLRTGFILGLRSGRRKAGKV